MSTRPLAASLVRSVPAASPRDEGWTTALHRILAEPHRVRVHYQPIVDLQRGVVRGYEALARFPATEGIGPRDWFDAAARLGYAGALEAQVIQAALVTRPLLVRDRFIAVNVSPAALLSGEVQAVFAAEPSLAQLVIELVDQEDGADPDAVAAALTVLRARGVMLAVDDAGTGARGLDRVTTLRPHFIKVDGAVIAGVDHDEARADVIRTLSDFAARADAWIVAEGIETAGQLDALVRLGVPLGQGYLLGRPAAAMAELDRATAGRLRRRTPAGVAAECLTALAEQVPIVAFPGGTAALTLAFASAPHAEHIVAVDAEGRPAAVLDRPAHERGTAPRPALCLLGALPVADAARRAMARPLATRLDPVAVVDQRGGYTGIVPIDRLVGSLAR